ncbi:MAG: hypothetical protein Q9162_005601 [Coniocarpon cinnabarinum]
MIGPYKPGQVVELGDGRNAVVQFAGKTSFADGDWVGVLLDEPTGKNDGCVKGVRYFECEPQHGMFLRPSAIAQVLEDPTPKPPQTKKPVPNGKPAVSAVDTEVKTRPSSMIANGVQRPSQDLSAVRRQSVNAASPSPAPRASINGRKSPSKLAPRAFGSSATSTASSSRGATPPARRNGLGMTASAKPPSTSRPSLTGTRARTNPSSTVAGLTRHDAAGSRPAATRAATATADQKPRLDAVHQSPRSSLATGQSATNGAERRPRAGVTATTSALKPSVSDPSRTEQAQTPSSPSSLEQIPQAQTNNFAPTAPLTQAPSPGREDGKKQVPLSAATSRHIQDLETQISVHKKQCDEYREQIAAMEKLRSERDRFQAIIERLQAKLQPQSQELGELRARLKASEKELEGFQGKDGDHEAELEMATLDREMAEEHAEAARLEVDALKEKISELEDEVEVLREENALMGEEISPEEKSSQGWLQLERSNERLKEALIRLREITQNKEAELTSQIANLEGDLKQYTGVNTYYEETKERLQQSEAAIEDLKEQLDEALDAENTSERLTTENIALQDQLDQLRVNIKELEDLKELNDELEYNHVEAEKQMQYEIDFKDSLISDQQRHTTEQSDKLSDYEYTINKFRELVANLQSGLEDMKASQQISEAEAEELNSRSKAMTDLNMKLQSSAEKAQMNVIDLEDRRLEAQEALEHLSIVQTFLPDSFKSERESVLTYLRFRRVGSKSRLLHSLMKSRIAHDGRDSHSDDVFVICDVLDKLVWIAAMCDRFVSHISGCSVEEFARLASNLFELDPVERSLNVYVGNIRKGELREQVAADELQRTTLVLTHLAETYLESDDLADYAESVLMRTSLMQSYLENTATALTHIRSAVAPDPDQAADASHPEDSLQQFFKETQLLISQSRNAKIIATRAHQSLSELAARSMSLDLTTSDIFVDAEESASRLAKTSCQLGSHLQTALRELDQNSSAATTVDQSQMKDVIRNSLRSFMSSYLPDTASSSPLSPLLQRLKQITTSLASVLESTTNLGSVHEFSRPEPPWFQRAAALRSAKQHTQDTEAELVRLKDAMQAQSQELRSKDQSLDENRVKIELLESRTKDASEKAARITDLSQALDAVQGRERDMLKRAEAHATEVAALSAEKVHWKNLAESRNAEDDGGEAEAKSHGSVPPTPRGEWALFGSREMDALRNEVDDLTSAVRFLREDSRKTRLAKPDEWHMAWLGEPLFKKRPTTAEEQHQGRTLKSRQREAFDALQSVVTDSEGLVELRKTLGSAERWKWRPAKQKTGWKVARQREEWVLWQSRCYSIVKDAEDHSYHGEANTERGATSRPASASDRDESAGLTARNGRTLTPGAGHKTSPADARSTTTVGDAELGEQIHKALSNAPRNGEELIGVAE